MKMGKHFWHMIVGCGLAAIGLVLLPVFNVKLGGVLSYLFLLACPLSMVAMMWSTGKHSHTEHGEDGLRDSHHAHDNGKSEALEAPTPGALPAPRDVD